MNITAIIPARKNSKRIPNKNIRIYANHPLIYWSIHIAQKSKYINNIIVSTDCPIIAQIASSLGSSVIMRPDGISQDLSTDKEFIDHYLSTTPNHPDLIVQLRPTYPNRNVKILDDCIEQFIKNINSYDSLRTVCLYDKPAYKMYNIQDNKLVPLFTSVNNISEPYNQPAQILPKTFWHNGYIDIIKPHTVLTQHSITGRHIYPYVMSSHEIDDIDTIEDWVKSENKFHATNICK